MKKHSFLFTVILVAIAIFAIVLWPEITTWFGNLFNTTPVETISPETEAIFKIL